MPIPVINYAALQPQGSPAFKNLMPSIQQGMSLAFAPKMMNEELMKNQLANALARINVQYAPEEKEANIGNTRAQTNLMGAQAQLIPSEMLLNTSKANAIPIENLLNIAKAMNQGNRFDDAFNLRAFIATMDPSTRAAFVANHAKEMNAIGEGLVNGVSGGGQGGQAMPGNQLLNSVLPRILSTLPASPTDLTLNEQDQNNLLKAGIAQPSTLPVSGTLRNMYQNPNSDKSAADMKNSAQLYANKLVTPTFMQNQGLAGMNIDNWLAENQTRYSKFLGDITQYSGTLGKGKKLIDQLKVKNPETLQEYNWFMNDFVPQTKAQISQMEKAGATDYQQKTLTNLLDSAVQSLTTDPAAAKGYLNQLFRDINSISKQRKNAAQPVFKNAYQDAYGAQEIPDPYIGSDTNNPSAGSTLNGKGNFTNISDKELQDTAKMYDITVKKLKMKLGINNA